MTVPRTAAGSHRRRLLRSAGAVLVGFLVVYTILGSYVTARLAPRNPMRHALSLGVIGTLVGTAGAIATIPMHLGPSWYPIALVLTALPCAWLGGALHGRSQTS